MKKYPFDRQEESKDCGAACLSMLIKYYGGYLNMERIKELINVGKNGTTAYNIIEGAKEIGFKAMGFQCALEQFEKEKIIFPLIANVIVNKSYTHFVVIYGINYRKKELIVADPADKIKKISFDSFNLIYNGIILILYPIQKIPLTNPTKVTWYDFKELLVGNKKFLINIFFLSFFVILYSVLTSFYSQIMLNSLVSANDYLLVIFITFLALNLIKVTSEYFRNIVFIYITQKIELIITMDSFNKILSLPYSYYRNHNTGDIIVRLKDISMIRDTVSRWIIVLIMDIPLMLVSFIILWFFNFKLASITLIIFTLYWLILKAFHAPLEKTIEKCHNENSILTSTQVEAINAFETIKGINIKNKIQQKIEKQEVSFIHSLHKYQKISLLQNYFKELVQSIGYLCIFYCGCCLVKDELLTLGTLLTFQSLVTYFLSPVRELVDLDADTKNLKKAIIRLKELFAEDNKNGYITERINGDIFLNRLSYSYKRSHKILNNINLKIKKGEKVLLMGKSGSGKSTLLKLIKKYYSVDRGYIKIGKRDINDFQNTDDILYINQTEFLFTDSLYDNITLRDKVDSKRLETIIGICEIDDIVKNNNLGYFMLLEENGFNLSGGERQRIVLARTLIKSFNILIVDEGLSQVDIDMERRILKRMFDVFNDKTIIVISHRLENSDLFDRNIELKNGRIFKDIILNG